MLDDPLAAMEEAKGLCGAYTELAKKIYELEETIVSKDALDELQRQLYVLKLRMDRQIPSMETAVKKAEDFIFCNDVDNEMLLAVAELNADCDFLKSLREQVDRMYAETETL